jgi:hypothetical protein
MYSIQHWWQTAAERKNLSTTLIETNTHAAVRSILATITHHNPDKKDFVALTS